MKPGVKLYVVLAAVGAAAVMTGASDRVGVYARVDRVVIEPSESAPETIQIWGVFSVAERKDGNYYRPAARGYLYYRMPSDRDAARREWLDLKSVAGSNQIVAFGSRWEGTPRVREDAAASDPDAYVLNTGVIKVSGRTDYAPIHELLAFAR